MILKGAIVSKERVSLEHSPRAASASSTPAARLELATTFDRVSAPAMTLDSVLTWLASQDDRIRTQLAARLAPEIERVGRAAEKEGFAAGESRGLKESQARTQASLALITRLVKETETVLQGEAARLAEDCADIVLEVLTRMAGPTLSTREAALQVVLQVIKRLTDEREILIRVSEQDLPVLSEGQESLRAAFGGRQLTLAADSRIELGGCLVESRLGSLDGRLETQLRAAFEAIHAARVAREEAG